MTREKLKLLWSKTSEASKEFRKIIALSAHNSFLFLFLVLVHTLLLWTNTLQDFKRKPQLTAEAMSSLDPFGFDLPV